MNEKIPKDQMTKAMMMWLISKEQEEIFRKGLPEEINGINVDDFLKMVRGAEYRRGKEDGEKFKFF